VALFKEEYEKSEEFVFLLDNGELVILVHAT
jgi:hypothetical protein